MWYRSLIIPGMIITIYCHTPKNNSDVIVTYSGHNEANMAPIPEPRNKKPETSPILIDQTTETTPYFDNDATDSVVFIPNEKPVFRNDDDYLVSNDKISVGDILTRGKSISDVLNDKGIRVETETPKQDILFISGKNNENDNAHETQKEKEKSNTRRSGKEIKRKNIMNCANLDCNNTLDSVCGGKLEHKTWRYRLFLNECYFRKVNCNFRYEENRFKLVNLDLCKSVAAHYSERPFIFKPSQPNSPEPKPTPAISRRSSSSRRALNIDSNGNFCSHPCPASCPEQYEPECAVSNRGVKRVFVNHCKLDFNSCSFGAVWQRRPLAECVGNRKADMTRNSAFIGWMQRVGIVDNKGRLTLE